MAFIQTRYNKLVFNGKDLTSCETPCFVFSRKILKTQYQKLKKTFNADILYSFKTNPYSKIARYLHEDGAGFTICSLEELEQIKKIIKNPRISFLDPSLADFDKLKGIKDIVIDSESQLKKINKENFNIWLRIDAGLKINRISCFGIPIEKADKIIQEVKPYGIHNHLVTQNTSIKHWKKNIQKLAEFAKKHNIKNINIGGGFPIQYLKKVPTLKQIASAIKPYLKNFNITIEPGRYIVAPAGILLTKVKTIKKLRDKDIAVLDASAYNSSMDTMLIAQELPCLVANKMNKKPTTNYILKGCTPDSLDIFRKNVKLPELKEGDIIAFINAGAYTFASDFVSLKKPGVFFI